MRLLECDIEDYLHDRVIAAGGLVRKVKWMGARNAPDRLVLLPGKVPAFVEVKSPFRWATFPKDAHERAQNREHIRLRKLGVRVELIGTKEQVDELIGNAQ